MDYRALMSGKRKGPVAIALRAGLRVLSIPYGFVVGIRNRRFDHGKSQIHTSDVPVISVGNLTTGGTGKTPIVCFLATWFRQHHVRVCIVSRGYGRGDEMDQNDEAMELHARLPDVPHVQDPDRVEAARVAVDELETQLVLMDDGFQHRRLHRDLDIVVIDATCPFGYGYKLPRGLLREPIKSIRRADCVMVSKCSLAEADAFERIKSTVQEHHPDVPVVACNHAPTSLLSYPSEVSSLDQLRDANVAVVSAIGNPDSFADTVRGCGANIVAQQSLPDHDPYAPDTIERLRDWITAIGDQVECVVCTHKDLVKLQMDRLGGKPVYAIVIELQIVDNLHLLDQTLRGVLDQIEL